MTTPTAEMTTLHEIGFAAEQVKHWTGTRDEMIRDAYHNCVPVPKIAEAAGVTRSRIYQVLRKAD